MITRFLRFIVPLCLVATLLLQANISTCEDPNHPEVKTLKVALLPYLSYGPFFIAQEEGYFAEQGLQIEVIRFTSSPDAVPALIQGRLDIAGGFMTVSMLNAMARGARIRFVADKSFSDPTGCTYHGLVAGRVLVERGGLESPAKLKGRRIAIH